MDTIGIKIDMKQNTVLKNIMFLLCAVLVLCLAACKNDVTNNSDNVGSENSGYTHNSDVTTSDEVAKTPNTSSSLDSLSGIELEEDVFENGEDILTENNTSDEKVSDNNDSEDNSADNKSDQKTDNGNTATTPDNSDNTESGGDSADDNESEEITSSDDGVIRLPIDRFD